MERLAEVSILSVFLCVFSQLARIPLVFAFFFFASRKNFICVQLLSSCGEQPCTCFAECTVVSLSLLNVFQRNEKGESPLHRACIEGSLRKVKLLIDTVIASYRYIVTFCTL